MPAIVPYPDKMFQLAELIESEVNSGFCPNLGTQARKSALSKVGTWIGRRMWEWILLFLTLFVLSIFVAATLSTATTSMMDGFRFAELIVAALILVSLLLRVANGETDF